MLGTLKRAARDRPQAVLIALYIEVEQRHCLREATAREQPDEHVLVRAHDRRGAAAAEPGGDVLVTILEAQQGAAHRAILGCAVSHAHPDARDCAVPALPVPLVRPAEHVVVELDHHALITEISSAWLLLRILLCACRHTGGLLRRWDSGGSDGGELGRVVLHAREVELLGPAWVLLVPSLDLLRVAIGL